MSPLVASGCSVTECTRQHYAKSLCRRHYERVVRHGDPNAGRALHAGSRIPKAFAEHGMTHRQVEWQIEQGYIRVGRAENGHRVWDQREVAVGVLAYRLHEYGLRYELAAKIARQYITTRSPTLRVDLFRGLQLKLAATGARAVGK